MKITLTRPVSILLRFHAVSSRLPLNFWHGNDPERNRVRLFAHAPRGVHAPRGMNAKNRTRRLESVDSNRTRFRESLQMT